MRFTRRSKTFSGLIFFLFLMLAGHRWLDSGFFTIEQVQVRGTSNLSPQEVIQAAGIAPGTNILRLEEKRVKNNLKLHPLIADVTVERKLPRTVIINVTERKPVAVIPADKGFVFIDEESHIMMVRPVLGEAELPFLTGPVINKLSLQPGDKIEDKNVQEAVRLLCLLPAGLEGRIKEVYAARTDQMLMYTSEGIEVRLGGTDQVEDKLRKLESILAELGRSGELWNVSYIDVRFDGPPVVGLRH